MNTNFWGGFEKEAAVVERSFGALRRGVDYLRGGGAANSLKRIAYAPKRFASGVAHEARQGWTGGKAKNFGVKRRPDAMLPKVDVAGHNTITGQPGSVAEGRFAKGVSRSKPENKGLSTGAKVGLGVGALGAGALYAAHRSNQQQQQQMYNGYY